jgi:DNA-binding transcriptional LysR family regulator
MDTRELSKIDLNLLISLQVLLEENNVSRAAERLYITQPAMSKTLSRLRELFDDPLFTRSGHGMQPTPRALELADGLGGILGDISKLVAGARFDPATFDGEVTLALSDYIGVALLPELVRRLQGIAPFLRMKVVTRIENPLEQMAMGRLDFAVQLQRADYGRDYRVMPLGGSPPAILMRQGHPLANGPVTRERLEQFPIIRPYLSDQEQAEIQRRSVTADMLREGRRGSLEISHLLTALEVLRHTDYFMPAPAYVLQNTAATRDIIALPLPREDNYVLDYALVSHRRTLNSPLHNWLWREITCTIRDLRTPTPLKLRRRVPAGGTDSSA